MNDPQSPICRLYSRLAERTHSQNLRNRVHIELETRITPLEWAELQRHSETLRADDAFLASWLQTLSPMMGLSGKPRTEPFERRRLAPGVMLYAKGQTADARKRSLVVCFTGRQRRMMMAAPVFLQHLDARVVDVVLVRCPRDGLYANGLPGLALDMPSLFEQVALIAGADRYARVVTMGTSAGAIPSLLFGLRHGCKAVLAVGIGAVDEPSGRSPDRGLEALARQFGRLGLRRTRVFLMHGADDSRDAGTTEAWASLVRALRLPVSSASGKVGHGALWPIAQAGQLSAILGAILLRGGPTLFRLQLWLAAARPKPLFKLRVR